MENTKYSSSSLEIVGEWLETPSASTSKNAYFLESITGTVKFFILPNGFLPSVENKNYKLGIRPAIEVSKANIDY